MSSFERVERSLKVSKLNTLSKILVWIKHGSTLSLENVCDSCHLHQSLARRPLCHKVNLPRSVARRLLCHKVNLPRYDAQRRHFIMTCDFYGTRQTNSLAPCFVFAKTKSYCVPA